MTLTYLIKGFLVGFWVAAPVGPMAIFCTRQTMAYGFWSGFSAISGVTLADAFFSWVAAVSSNVVSVWIQKYDLYFYILGGFILLIIGFKIFRSPPIDKKNPPKKRKAIKSFFATLGLTLASPMTTFLFLAMFTTYGVFESALRSNEVIQLVLGVVVGSMVWWIFLISLVNFVHDRYELKLFRYVNLISGAGIMGFGVYVIAKILYKYSSLI